MSAAGFAATWVDDRRCLLPTRQSRGQRLLKSKKPLNFLDLMGLFLHFR